jgi:hypothetical protein
MIQLKRIKYSDLNAKQKEIYNFQKVAGILADYGFNCMKLADDWQGADFLAYHTDRKDTLKVQLKSRLTIDKKFLRKGLCIAFPIKETWYLVEHDTLVHLVGKHSNWLNTLAWRPRNGKYHSKGPNSTLLESLGTYALR